MDPEDDPFAGQFSWPSEFIVARIVGGEVRTPHGISRVWDIELHTNYSPQEALAKLDGALRIAQFEVKIRESSMMFENAIIVGSVIHMAEVTTDVRFSVTVIWLPSKATQ